MSIMHNQRTDQTALELLETALELAKLRKSKSTADANRVELAKWGDLLNELAEFTAYTPAATFEPIAAAQAALIGTDPAKTTEAARVFGRVNSLIAALYSSADIIELKRAAINRVNNQF